MPATLARRDVPVSKIHALPFIVLASLGLVLRCGTQASAGAPAVPQDFRALAVAGTTWTFTADPGVRMPNGVSPKVIRLADGVLLAYVTDIGPMSVYRSSDGLTFTQIDAQTPPGHDATIVSLPDGRWRMYYDVQPDPSGGIEIDSAVSSDALTWTVEAGTRISLANSNIGGVPEATVLPDGSVRIYYIVGGNGRLETIDSATSTDGLTFNADSDPRLTGGYVDPAVVRLSDGTWLMAVSRTPREQQRIYLAHSVDGLRWTVDPQPIILLANGANALDPTLLPLADGSIRVYFAEAAKGNQLSGPHQVLSGLLTQQVVTTTPAPSCAVVAHDAANGASEFAVTCNRDITNGSVFIDVNRGGPSHMTVSQPAGDTLQCSARGIGNGNQPQPTERLDCEGSLLASTSAQLVVSLAMFSGPCDAPAFTGTVTIHFGDGSSFGPRPLGPYRCAPKTHLRRFTQFDSGSTPQGQGFIGSIAPRDGFTRCVRHVQIWIQRRVGSRWLTVARTWTSNEQRLPPRGTTFSGLVGVAATYRAYAPRLRFGNQVCPAVVSRPS